VFVSGVTEIITGRRRDWRNLSSKKAACIRKRFLCRNSMHTAVNISSAEEKKKK